jgi:hypothetical protein
MITTLNKQLAHIREMFGTPSEPETRSSNIRIRIKTVINKTEPVPYKQYYAQVKFSFFGFWKKLKWQYFNEQPKQGFTEARATTLYSSAYPTSLKNCQELLDDFLEHKGAGITIW